ncbi:PTS lactose/cellobiose transporter subunit IIA [Lactococcus garvieae]
MEGLELIAFNIISTIGTAKSKVMESMIESRKGNFEKAAELIAEANEFIVQGEQEHFKVITQEAKKEKVELTLLFIHAEDQLMSTVTLRDIAYESIENYRMLYDLKKTVEEKCKG